MTVGDCIGDIVSDDSWIRRFCSDGRGKANIGFCNVQSLKPGSSSTKFDELKNMLINGHLDIVGFAETWLKPYVSGKSVSIPGYNLFRNDRRSTRGGGVALYISSNIKARVLLAVSEPGCEALFLHIDTSGSSLVVGVFYLPHGDIDILEDCISEIVTRYEHIVLVGDFNFNIAVPRNYDRIRHMLTRCNMSVLHNNKPTHHDLSHDSSSLIDFTLVSNTRSVVKSSQFYFPAFNSHHAFLLIQYELQFTGGTSSVTYRDYEAIDMNYLVYNILYTDFSALYSTNDSDIQLSFLNSLLIGLFNTHVPEKTRIINSNGHSWFTPEVSIAIFNRDLAYRAYMEDRTDRNRDIHKHYRATARRIIRQTKKSYGARIFSGINSPRDFWSHMRHYGASKCDNYSCDIDPDNLNCYFTSVSSPSVSHFDNLPRVDRVNDLNFRNIDEYELYRAVCSIKSNAVGVDMIPIKFLKIIYPFISIHILHLFNTIIMTGHFPSDWRLAKVIPLLKKGTTGSQCSDFRPISVLPTLSKVFEMVIKNQICAHLDLYSLIDYRQSGFRRHHSTTSLVVHLTDEIRRCMDVRHPGILAILDLSKAFDSVDHNILLHKLFSQFHFSYTSCVLVQSFLSHRSQFVVSNGCMSYTRELYSGVPQGSILGPMLFMLYVNELRDCVLNSKLGIYADDIQLFCSSSSGSISDSIRDLDLDIGLVCDWCVRHNISINVGKTKCSIFGYGRAHLPSSSIIVQNNSVSFTDTVSCLGFEIDCDLNFNGHIARVCSRVNIILRRLYSLDVILPTEVKYKLAHALLMPNILYGIEVYSGTTAANLRKLHSCFHGILRFVYGRRSRDDYDFYSSQLLGCSFKNFLHLRCLYFLFCIVKYGLPLYLFNSITFLNTSRNTQILLEHFTHLVLERSFSVRVARLWNALPHDLKNFSVQPYTFKRNLLNYFAALEPTR